jgi:hypothetical protein
MLNNVGFMKKCSPMAAMSNYFQMQSEESKEVDYFPVSIAINKKNGLSIPLFTE